ncbi:MAG: hypothetical protein IJU64_03465 [Bacilli bacterium]|nr:hypothetical protein [Bacilli bacterium]
MNNLKSLIKIEFGKFLSSFSSGRKKRNTPIFYIAIFVGLFGMAMSAGYSFLILHSYVEAKIDPAGAVAFFAGVASLFVFMSAMNQARGIYIGDDYDLLTSLPIKRRDIVASKIITIYLTELLFSTMIMLPHAVVLIIMTHHVPLLLLSLLLAVTLPIVPVAIAVLFSLLVTMATSRFRYANLVVTLFYTAFIVAIAVLGIVTRDKQAAEAAAGFGAIGGVLKWVNPAYGLIELSVSISWFFLFAYMGVNVLAVIFTVLFFSLSYEKLHDLVSSISYKPKAVHASSKNKNETKLLLSLETKRLLSSRIYFINSCMGAIMAIVGTVVFLISMKNGMDNASPENPEAAELISLMVIPIMITISCMILGLTSPAASGISIEGKSFWIMKSLPIDYKKYMHVKLLFPLLIFVPAALLTSTIAVIFFHNYVEDIIFAFLIPLAYVVLNTIIGLWINLRHVKLKWNNEAEVVKNSAAILIGLLLDFALTIVMGAILIVMPIFTRTALWGYIAVFSAIVIAIIPCYLHLRHIFPTKIEAIEDL